MGVNWGLAGAVYLLSGLMLPVSDTPAPPPGAETAGYTTLALDNDFTKPMPANWLGGCANPGNGQPNNPMYFDDGGPHSWWQNRWWSRGYQPCNIGPVTDPVYGGTVLDIPWVVDPNYGALGNNLVSASWDYDPVKHIGQARTFPVGSYYEIVGRADPPALRGNYFAFWTWGEAGLSGGPSGIEWDVIEGDGSNFFLWDSNIINWSCGKCGGGWILDPWDRPSSTNPYPTGPNGIAVAPGTNLDPTNYNTYGLRVTTDGTEAIGCTYVNNVFQRCQPLGGLTPDEKLYRNVLLITEGCNDWAEACSTGTMEHFYVKSVRVWSCKDWATTQCPGPLLSAAP